MAILRVHNISHQTPGPAAAYWVAGQKIRPGHSIEVDFDRVGAHDRTLHGRQLWFGALPEKFTAPLPAPAPLTRGEAQAYLARLSDAALLDLCDAVAPPVTLSAKASRGIRAAHLLAALFLPATVVDPEKFFWLRRWRRIGTDFVEEAR